jgi:hypothetical protein
VKVRSSFGCNAPTPTNWRATSSPRALRMVSSIVYSHAGPSPGWRIAPSTRNGECVSAALAACAAES